MKCSWTHRTLYARGITVTLPAKFIINLKKWNNLQYFLQIKRIFGINFQFSVEIWFLHLFGIYSLDLQMKSFSENSVNCTISPRNVSMSCTINSELIYMNFTFAGAIIKLKLSILGSVVNIFSKRNIYIWIVSLKMKKKKYFDQTDTLWDERRCSTDRLNVLNTIECGAMFATFDQIPNTAST